MRLRYIIDWLWGVTHEWDWHQLSPSKEVVGIDGKTLRGWVMRRKINDQIQYRAYTEADLDERDDDNFYFETPP